MNDLMNKDKIQNNIFFIILQAPFYLNLSKGL